MCCEINIANSISLRIGLHVQEWFLSPTVPNNKPYVHTYFRYSSKYCCVQNFFGLVYNVRTQILVKTMALIYDTMSIGLIQYGLIIKGFLSIQMVSHIQIMTISLLVPPLTICMLTANLKEILRFVE